MNKKILVHDLWGDGNAFAILGKCRRAARKAKWTPEQMNEFSKKAKQSDFDHLLQVVQQYFDDVEFEEDEGQVVEEDL